MRPIGPSLRAEIISFHEYLYLTDGSGKLTRLLGKPWMINRKEAVDLIGQSGVDLDARRMRKLVEAWKTAVKRIHGKWSSICDQEEQVDEAVAKSYRIRKACYNELRERAPACSIEDALLPR